MKFDLGIPETPKVGWEVDPGLTINFTGRGEHAERKHRQIICAVQACDTVQELHLVYADAAVVIDALHFSFPEFAEAICTAVEDHHIMLTGFHRTADQLSADAEAERDGLAQSNAPDGQHDKEPKMNQFASFDTGGGGSEGPWLGWSARGAQDGSVPPKSFFLRDKDGRAPFDMSKGIVLDIHNMKTGWCYSSGIAGQAPDYKWNPSVTQFMQKPGDDYKKALQIRCAIGGGNTATWEDSGAGAWNGFAALVPHLAQGPDGQLPLVRMSGSKDEKYARGGTTIPTLEIVKWVPRPDCLKEGAAAGIATDPAPAPAPAPQKAPEPVAVTSDEF